MNRVVHIVRSIGPNNFSWNEINAKQGKMCCGPPWVKGEREVFNGNFGSEVLNAEWFSAPKQALIVIIFLLMQYRHARPQSGTEHETANTRFLTKKVAHNMGLDSGIGEVNVSG